MGVRSDLIVVGGGIIGLFAALRLVQEGFTITLFDDARPGAATPAAAGMLAPLAECTTQGPLLQLCLGSLEVYPAFLAQILPELDQNSAIFTNGLLRAARSDSEEEILRRTYDWQKDLGLPLELLNGPEVRKLQPGTSDSVQAATLSGAERSIHPSWIQEQARTVAINVPCIRVVFERVVSVERHATSVEVRTAVDTYYSGDIILSAGSWTPGLTTKLADKISPVKGQVASVSQSISCPLEYSLFSQGTYLVPRPNNTIVVGATMEPEAKFDSAVDPDAVKQLIASASTLFPYVAHADCVSSSAGLRPMSQTDFPLIGPMSAAPNMVVATGHGRKGILLAPITAIMLSDHFTGRKPLPSID